ncbi:MAG: hypothetical protein GXO23_00270 [Crenarchaeota archaeon]|nr:hypothetical protein [Thermoproteota archaeon]
MTNSTHTISIAGISKNIVTPFLKYAFDIVSIVGGIALWMLIIYGIIKVVESKIGPTGWYRASALTNLFENFKRFIISIVLFYVTIYVIAYIMSSMGANITPSSFVTSLLLNMLFKPFITLYKLVIPSK